LQKRTGFLAFANNVMDIFSEAGITTNAEPVLRAVFHGILGYDVARDRDNAEKDSSQVRCGKKLALSIRVPLRTG
jgi:tRNA(His) 5'-end guanylyltransferase